MKPPEFEYESQRLEVLARYQILDTAPEEVFDRVTRLAVAYMGVPIALVSLVDETRQWFKSRIGLEVGETGRDVAFCAYAIASDEVMVVPDATMDKRFIDSPLVLGDPFIRFYAGAPLKSKEGYRLGTLCVIDKVPRQLDDIQLGVLQDLADLVVEAMESRRANIVATQAITATAAAEQANRAKSAFLSRMSHELRTPLNAIVGFGEILNMEQLSPTQLEYVGHILKAGTHLSVLINEVLEIARIEAGQQNLSFESVNVKDLVNETWGLMRPMALERSVTLTLDLGTDNSLYVLADLQRLRQVILNLLSNAVKYNRANGTIEVFCERYPEDGLIRILFRDTGLGIDEADYERVFQVFERLGADKGREEGSGVGLALSRALMAAMNGALGVSSKKGVGTTFWLDLPQGIAAVEMQKSQLQGDTQVRSSLPTSSRVSKILYIEDNLSNLRLVEALLAKRPGLELTVAMQGNLGLDLARRHHPDLILLDIHLPDISGDEVLIRLRDDSTTSNIPVIILSADATRAQVDKLMALGADAYLTKPLDIRQFMSTIDTVLTKNSG